MVEMTAENSRTGLEIAVIGMAGRFPGASNITEFWNNLKNGVESISFFSDKELIEAEIAPEEFKNPNYVKARSNLKDSEYFDSNFFNYSLVEAEVMDPQLRIFHECVWHALEDAGYDPAAYRGLIGLYAGARSSFHWEANSLLSGKNDILGEFAVSTLNDKDYLSSRISYRLNLKGPCCTIQTACSTSLVAIHLACQGLLSAECDMALAGGVSISISQTYGYLYQEGMIYSPDGHCRTFDATAKGTIFGDGIGIVVLKRYDDAIKDGDHIYAVIKGSACNNDGVDRIGFTAPGIGGQTAVIQAALRMAEVDPETIGYVEAHGTGTSLGDPIEIEALTRAFNTEKKGYCGIGSVKTNVGHLNTAAGIAGFIKTVLALKYRLVPPSLHFKRPNPEIDFKNSPFYVNTVLREWNRKGYPRRAGVSSFGIGGTNAHVILEEWADDYSSGAWSIEHGAQSHLILLSAKTETALDKVTERLANHFKQNRDINLVDLAYTLQVGRRAFNHRRALVCSDGQEAVDILSTPGSEKIKTFFPKEGKKPVIFMFPGQGAQYVNMGLELYKTEQVFRAAVDRCVDILKPLMGDDIKEILYPGNLVSGENLKENEATKTPRHQENTNEKVEGQPGASTEKINQTEMTQPVLFVFEYALAKLLMKWGIHPSAMIGHSIGEYVAACLSGLFSLENALSLVVLRGQLMQKMPPGAMLSVSLPKEELEPLLNEEISLAAVNAPSLCVVSGTFQAVEDFEKQLIKQGFSCRRLHTSHAYHSTMMEPILDEFKEKVKQTPLESKEPQIPYISNLTGTWITAEEVADPGYWANHLRWPVRFADGLTELLRIDEAIFIEVGPGRSLSAFVKKHTDTDKKTSQKVINLIKHPKEKVSDLHFLLNKIGELWLYGKEIDWAGFNTDEKRYRIPLPGYPFEQHYFQIQGNVLKNEAAEVSQNTVNIYKKNMTDWFYIPSWKQSMLTKTEEKLKPSIWLVFIDEGSIGAQLIKKLIHAKQEVITVKAGSEFRKAANGLYVFDPQQRDHYDTLVNELQALERIPQNILHLWGITETETRKSKSPLEPAAFANIQVFGFYSLLYLARAIGRQGLSHDIRLMVVSNNMQEVIGDEILAPEKTPVLGPIKVIPQEYPNMRCRSIDIEYSNQGKQKPEVKKQIDQLVKEVTSEVSDTLVAYRKNRRWVRSFEQVKLKESEHSDRTIVYRKRGVYLITGGLGGIGLILAEHLARRVSARLILTGRSHFPAPGEWQGWLKTHGDGDKVSRKILKLQELESLGADVLVLSADVSNLQHMQDVISKAEARFGQINGVIHAAGIVGEKAFVSIKSLSKTLCEHHFLPKIQGLWVLEKVLKGKKPEFCLLMSSLSSVLGGLGHAAYSAANIFMDHFVHLQNRTGKTHWISVNWDTWHTGETKETSSPASSLGKTVAEMAMTGEEGAAAFQRILSRIEAGQVAVSTHDLQTRINRWITFDNREAGKDANRKEAGTLQPRPDLSSPFTPPESQLERLIADIWQELLGVEKIGIYDNFFDLGATSLDIIQVNKKLMQKSGKNIPVDMMFEYPSIAFLAKYLSGNEEDEEISNKSLAKSAKRMDDTFQKFKRMKNG